MKNDGTLRRASVSLAPALDRSGKPLREHIARALAKCRYLRQLEDAARVGGTMPDPATLDHMLRRVADRDWPDCADDAEAIVEEVWRLFQISKALEKERCAE